MTNSGRCLYDGGDCCKEQRDEKYCTNCACFVEGRFFIRKSNCPKNKHLFSVNKQEQDSQNLTLFEATPKSVALFSQLQRVRNVGSLEMCNQLCTDLDEESNLWTYDQYTSRSCTCLNTTTERLCDTVLGQPLPSDLSYTATNLTSIMVVAEASLTLPYQ